MPFLAPASIAMLVIVSRASMSMDLSASPTCSIAVDPNLTDHIKDEVLGLDPLLESIVKNELQRLGHAEPQLAEGEHAGEIGGADAGREVVEGAIGAAVRVGADDQLTRQHKPVLRQHRVADAALSHLEVPLDAHLVRELAGEAAEGRPRRVFCGLEVVLCDRDALGIPDLLRAHLLAHDLAGGRGSQVVALREVDLREDSIPPAHAVAAPRARAE